MYCHKSVSVEEEAGYVAYEDIRAVDDGTGFDEAAKCDFTYDVAVVLREKACVDVVKSEGFYDGGVAVAEIDT